MDVIIVGRLVRILLIELVWDAQIELLSVPILVKMPLKNEIVTFIILLSSESWSLACLAEAHLSHSTLLIVEPLDYLIFKAIKNWRVRVASAQLAQAMNSIDVVVLDRVLMCGTKCELTTVIAIKIVLINHQILSVAVLLLVPVDPQVLKWQAVTLSKAARRPSTLTDWLIQISWIITAFISFVMRWLWVRTTISISESLLMICSFISSMPFILKIILIISMISVPCTQHARHACDTCIALHDFTVGSVSAIINLVVVLKWLSQSLILIVGTCLEGAWGYREEALSTQVFIFEEVQHFH